MASSEGYSSQDPQEKQIEKLLRIADECGLDAEELFTAYQLALGVPQEEGQEIRPEVRTFAEVLDKEMKDGLALNRIAKMIDGERVDDPIDVFGSLVEEMRITPKERLVLKSIVEKNRFGEITVREKNGGEEHTLAVSKNANASDPSPKNITLALSRALADFLSRFLEKEVEVYFEEQ